MSMYDRSLYEEGEWEDMYGEGEPRFANPGSALRASSASNPRNLPCPTCGVPNRLTPADQARGYCCDRCAETAEGLWPG
jgi:hypothetical protein